MNIEEHDRRSTERPTKTNPSLFQKLSRKERRQVRAIAFAAALDVIG
jgi:hypothetical protein